MNLPAGKLLQNEYRTRLNRAIDYIHNHYHENLNLTQLARIACFSKFHFHRLFHAMVGETLNDFIQRIRLERSVPKLTGYPSKSITEIALECGFSCSQNFAKAFKARYGVTPTDVRKEFNWDEMKVKMMNLRLKKVNDLNPAEAFLYRTYQDKRNLSLDKILDQKQAMQVTIAKVPDLRVAYIRQGPFTQDSTDSAFEQLRQWAESRELINKNTVFLSVMWYLPSITPTGKLIRDDCMTVSQTVKPDKWVNIQTVPGGKFAINRCEVEPARIRETWASFAMQFLLSGDYQLADRPFCQIWHNHSESKSPGHRVLDLYLPIKSLYE